MKRTLSIAVVGVLACAPAFAAEYAYTVRPTELKAKPFTDAATVASLAEASKVDVLARQASWIQIQAASNTGWVKMLSLRFDAATAGKGSSNMAVLFNIAATGASGSAPSTAVKGVSEEALKNPHPNPEAFKQMMDMQVSAADMTEFMRAGKLEPKKMAYVAAPAEGAKK
jgi:hypothetical protein